MNVHQGSLRVLTLWLERMIQVHLSQGTPRDGTPIKIINQAIGAIHQLKKEPMPQNNPPSHHPQVSGRWIDLALEDLFRFNSLGDEYICSTIEAVVKVHGIKQLYDGFAHPMYYRGEPRFGWELISRLGRKVQIDWAKEDATRVSKRELEFLRDFQDRCERDKDLRRKVSGGGQLPSREDAGWWSLMQHYDQLLGTRMIDLTSSIFCALYFACEDWNGFIDSSVDGKLYMFPTQPGRTDTLVPDRIQGQLVGPEDRRSFSVESYFDIEIGMEVPRFRESHVRNDRALAQDGHFIWQPFFDKPLNRVVPCLAFRIHRDYKRQILQELASLGYTTHRILAQDRFLRSPVA